MINIGILTSLMHLSYQLIGQKTSDAPQVSNSIAYNMRIYTNAKT